MKKRSKTENGSTPQHPSMHTDRVLDSILHHPLVSKDPAVRRIISQAVKEEFLSSVQQLPSSSFLPAADTSASTSAHKRRGAGASRKFKPKRG